MAQGWYFKVGSATPKSAASSPPTYPTQVTQTSNTR
ncbi:hypothetical protein LCGC14_2903160, partial [marine sediment metagenome]